MLLRRDCSLTLLLLAACGIANPQTKSKPNSPLRQIIFYSGARGVKVAKDAKAVESMISQIKSPSDDAIRAQVKAAEIDGRVFVVADGTRGDVIKEFPVSLRGGGVSGLSLLSVRIRNGPHANEQVFVFSSATQPAR